VENALRVLLAIGGSTNAIVHLTAIAGRVGVKIDLGRLNVISDSTPVLVDLKPTGSTTCPISTARAASARCCAS
jgi:dihydroxy-acid dehydratase